MPEFPSLNERQTPRRAVAGLPRLAIILIAAGMFFWLGMLYGQTFQSATLLANHSPTVSVPSSISPSAVSSTVPSAAPSNLFSGPTDHSAGWSKYQSTSHGLSFLYPNGWKLSENSSSTNGVDETVIQISNQPADAPFVDSTVTLRRLVAVPVNTLQTWFDQNAKQTNRSVPAQTSEGTVTYNNVTITPATVFGRPAIIQRYIQSAPVDMGAGGKNLFKEAYFSLKGTVWQANLRTPSPDSQNHETDFDELLRTMKET